MVKNNLYFKIFGIFYILIAVIAFIGVFLGYDSSSVLWISYFAFLFIGIGIFKKNSYLIGSWLNIIFIPYFIWSIDFFHVFFTRVSLWGITDYVFMNRMILSQIITLQHLFVIPIALVALYFIKIKRKDFWKLSFIQVFIILFLTRLFTEPAKNINCAFENCLPFDIISVYYPFFWLGAFVIMIGLINFILIFIKPLNK